jgi:trehalose 6-phosphate phosphatase
MVCFLKELPLAMLTEVQRAIADRPTGTRLLFLSDYDGTLAEFHDDPTIPLPPRHVAELLGKLAERTDLSFGIVSGRRIADLRTRTQLPARVYMAGLHGLEIEVGSDRWQHPDLERARQHVRSLYGPLGDLSSRYPGLLIEDKHASLAVHVRAVAPELRAAALAAADRCAGDWVSGGKVRRLTGDLVVEFLPNIAVHKGDATRWIARHVQATRKERVWTVFVGDDVTDEDAFKVIDHGLGVLVGSRQTHATYRLADTQDVCRLLRWLTSEVAHTLA